MVLDDNVRAFLAEKRFAVLATINSKGVPQQTVMWYDLEGDEILMNTTAERVKFRNLSRNPWVSICVPDGYYYVTLVGTARLIDDPVIGQRDIARLARRYHPAEVADRQIKMYQTQHRVTIHIAVTSVVAKFE